MTAMTKRIREAFSENAPLLAGLICDSFKDVAQRFCLTPENCPKHPSNYTNEWVQADFNRGVDYFIMEIDAKSVGCVALEMVGDDLCYLERLAVLPQFRRMGYGRQLTDHVINAARARGAKHMSIGIISAQAELKQWYEKIGFLEGDTKIFQHLPFHVTFMTYKF